MYTFLARGLNKVANQILPQQNPLTFYEINRRLKTVESVAKRFYEKEEVDKFDSETFELSYESMISVRNAICEKLESRWTYDVTKAVSHLEECNSIMHCYFQGFE